MKTKERTIVAKKLFGRKGRYWLFPSAPKPKIPMADSVRATLPFYTTYPEFLSLTEPSLVACALPDKTDVLKVCRQIKVTKGDFLAQDWMKWVSKAWRETISPVFAFRSVCGTTMYWWCSVRHPDACRDVWTYLIFAVEEKRRLLHYTVYSAGEVNDDSHYYLVRSNKTRFEKEETFLSSKTFIANVRKMFHRRDHFICQENSRNEFLQAIRSRDGTYYMEYQMYYMPWQMMRDDLSMKDVLRLLRLFLMGGIPAISNATEWTLCEHNSRKPFDLGIELVKRLAKAEKSGCREIVDTIHAVGVTSKTPSGQIVYPTFLNKRGRPVHWESTLYYLPKSVSRKVKALIRVCASLDKDILPYHLHELGKIFSTGSGVRRNYKLALFWEKKALRRGSAAARQEVSKLKAILDPEHKRKSTKRRARFQSKIAVALRNFTTGKINCEDAYDLIYDILVAAECCERDGRMTPKDSSIVVRLCGNVLRGVDDGSISVSQPSLNNRNRRPPLRAVCGNDEERNKVMKWKKRDCPIHMEIDPYGSGWEDITLDICGDNHWWSVSGCLGDGFWALVESLYALYPHQTYDKVEQNRLTEEEEFFADFVDGEYTNFRPRKKGEEDSFLSYPKAAEFFWDHEGWGVRWKLTKESGQEREFNLTIDLEETDDAHKTFHYTVKYSDLCYAVGKAITEALKKHGFGGFHTSVWESDVNVRHLCFLKACGMGNPDAVQPFDSAEKGVGAVSSFADEIELLLFDM